MTKYSVTVLTKDYNWESIAIFSDTADLKAMKMFAYTQYEISGARNIHLVDLDTGEILFDRTDIQGILEDGAHIVIDEVVFPPEVEDWEPDDIDDDMGFDPYEGCFTFDC